MIELLVLIFTVSITALCLYFMGRSIFEGGYTLVALAISITSSGVFIALFGEDFPISLFQIILLLFFGISFIKIVFYDRELRTANYYILSLLFILVISISLFYSKGIEGGLINSLRIITLYFFVFLIVQIRVRNELLVTMINVVVSVAIIISCISILENILNPEIAIQNVLSSGLKIDRASAGGIYSDPNRFAAALFLPTIYCFIKSLTSEKIDKKIIFGSCLIVLIVGIVSSYSRSAFFALGVTLLFVTIYLRKIPQLTLLSIIGLILIFVTPPLRDSFLLYGDRILELLSGNIDTSSSIRLMLGSAAIAMFIDSNMIGVGFGAFSENFIKYFSTQESVGVVEPHNIFYTVFAELGIIGFAIFLLILIKLFIEGFFVIKNVRNQIKPLAVSLLACLFCYMIFYQFYGGALYDAGIYLIIGLILMMKMESKDMEYQESQYAV